MKVSCGRHSMSPCTYSMHSSEYYMDQHVASSARSRADACRRARTLSRQLMLCLQWLGTTRPASPRQCCKQVDGRGRPATNDWMRAQGSNERTGKAAELTGGGRASHAVLLGSAGGCHVQERAGPLHFSHSYRHQQ